MNIFVANLNFKYQEEELRETFEAYGEVESARIITDRNTGRSKGYGFVEMTNDEEAVCIIYDRLTEAKGNYVQVSLYMYSCYNALAPINLSISNMAHYAFGWVLRDKRYGKKASKKEQKRTYTKRAWTVEDMLSEMYPGKYIANGLYEGYKAKNIDSDKSNLIIRLNLLHDNNIFYRWRYKRFNMLFMERYFSSWKLFNHKGCMLPKSLLSIVFPIWLS